MQTKRYCGKILCVLLTLAVILSSVGCNNSKEKEQQKKKCAGAVEDYMEYLIRSKTDKLNSYCARKDDPFQSNKDDLDANILKIVLKNMEYEIQNTSIEKNDGKVTVQLRVLDAETLVKNEGISRGKLEEFANASDKKIEETVDLELYLDEDDKVYYLNSSAPVYEIVKKQVKAIDSSIPAIDEKAITTKVDDLMRAYRDADYKFFSKYSDTPGATDYVENVFFKSLYKAEASYLTYSVEIVSVGETIVLNVHCSTRRAEEAWTRILSDPENLVPLMVPMIPALLKGTNFMNSEEDLFEVMDFDAMIPKLKEEMDKEPIVNIDIPCVLKVRDDGVIEPEVHGNFKEILPVCDFAELAPDYDVDVTEMYLKAAELALKNDKITEDQFKVCRMAMSERQKSKEEIISILKAHGYVNDTYNTAGDVIDSEFLNEKLLIHLAFEEGEDFEDSYEYAMDGCKEIMELIAEKELDGSFTGGPLYGVYAGGAPESYTVDTIRCYVIVANDYCFTILVLEDTKEKVEHLDALLEELGLKP